MLTVVSYSCLIRWRHISAAYDVDGFSIKTMHLLLFLNLGKIPAWRNLPLWLRWHNCDGPEKVFVQTFFYLYLFVCLNNYAVLSFILSCCVFCWFFHMPAFILSFVGSLTCQHLFCRVVCFVGSLTCQHLFCRVVCFVGSLACQHLFCCVVCFVVLCVLLILSHASIYFVVFGLLPTMKQLMLYIQVVFIMFVIMLFYVFLLLFSCCFLSWSNKGIWLVYVILWRCGVELSVLLVT